MKKNLTELVFILDRSGSMGGLEQDTTDGLENASKRFGYEKIRRMIEREKSNTAGSSCSSVPTWTL